MFLCYFIVFFVFKIQKMKIESDVDASENLIRPSEGPRSAQVGDPDPPKWGDQIRPSGGPRSAQVGDSDPPLVVVLIFVAAATAAGTPISRITMTTDFFFFIFSIA
jgi:hypothetical protein